MRSILLLPLVAICLETKMDVYGASLFYACCGDCARVCVNVSCVPNTTLKQTSSPDIITVSNTLYNRT